MEAIWEVKQRELTLMVVAGNQCCFGGLWCLLLHIVVCRSTRRVSFVSLEAWESRQKILFSCVANSKAVKRPDSLQRLSVSDGVGRL